MKKTLVCPKCDGRVIVHLESLKLPTADTQSFGAQMASRPAPLPVTVRTSWSGMRTHGGFETFICKACGYTELYAHGVDELVADEKNGVRIIDTRPPESLR